VLVAVPCSLLGVFLVLRRRAFIGEGLAHISFGGIALGLLLGLNPLIVALLITLLGSVMIQLIKDRSKLPSDTAIGIFSYTGFALGVFIISLTRGFNTDLFAYLFGSILTVSKFDLLFSVILSIITILIIILFYNNLFYITFDEETARTGGVNTGIYKHLIGFLVATTVVISMRIVGIILVASFMIIPAAAALQISKNFRQTLVYSIIICILSVLIGMVLSATFDFAASASIILVNFILFIMIFLARKTVA
jgi:zinc transport system permease protein